MRNPRFLPTRRTFITHAACAGAALPLLAPPLLRAASPNSKLNVAAIGVTRRGAANLKGVEKENLVALCDVDARNLAEAADTFAGAEHFDDYRRMFDRARGRFDAVVISTPDHHHAPASLIAMGLGKHVYCEKPLAHTVREVKMMIDAARIAGVATQMGTQIHAESNYRRVVEKIRAGAVGAVRQVHVFIGGSWVGQPIPRGSFDVPAHLNWDVWIGPALMRDYKPEIYHPRLWRGWWDFGGGALGDYACHYMDVAHWALDLRYPLSVQADGPEADPDRCTGAMKVHYEYFSPVSHSLIKLTWYHGNQHRTDRLLENLNIEWGGSGVLFVGDDGMLVTDYRRHRLLPEEKFRDYADPPQSIPDSIGHHAEWIRACKHGAAALCNFDYSGPLAATVLLGNVSHRAGNMRITYDPQIGRVTNSPAADRLLTRRYRPGWEIDRFA